MLVAAMTGYAEPRRAPRVYGPPRGLSKDSPDPHSHGRDLALLSRQPPKRLGAFGLRSALVGVALVHHAAHVAQIFAQYEGKRCHDQDGGAAYSDGE